MSPEANPRNGAPRPGRSLSLAMRPLEPKAPRRAVIFDMDGVLVDSEPLHEQAFLAVLEELGYGGRHGLRFADYIGRPDDTAWRDFIARHRPPQTLAELMRLKREKTIRWLRERQPVFPEVERLLEKLYGRWRLAVASGSEPAVVQTVLELRGLGRFFDVVLANDAVARGKPAPDIFLEAARRLEVPPAACWVIEDSKPGIEAARAAGMRVIALARTHPVGTLVEAAHVVRSHAEIGPLLGVGAG